MTFEETILAVAAGMTLGLIVAWLFLAVVQNAQEAARNRRMTRLAKEAPEIYAAALRTMKGAEHADVCVHTDSAHVLIPARDRRRSNPERGRQ